MTKQKTSLQRDPRLKRTMYSDIEVFGLEELQRALRGMPKQVNRQVQQGNKAIANHVVKQMKTRAKGVFHAQQYDLIIPSLKAVQGRVPKIRIGGKRVTRPGNMGAHKRTRETDTTSRWPPYAGQIVYGVEFGGRNIRRGYGNTMKFAFHRGKKGYVLFPTIKRAHGFIKNTFNKNIAKAINKRY